MKSPTVKSWAFLFYIRSMFKNTELFSPVAKKGMTKAPKGSREYADWWKEQRKRCLEGYTVNGIRITGVHYFYLNFWKIKGSAKKGERKTVIYPRFLDIDYEFFHEIERSRKEGKHFCIAKKRQAGYSEKAACLVGHEFTFFPGSQSIIVAGEEKYSSNTRNFVLRGLNDLAGTEFYKTKIPSTGDYIQAKRKVKMPDGSITYKGYMSEIYTYTANSNPEVVSGKSPSLIVFEECGRFPRVADTFGFVQPSLEAEGEKTGFALFIGTGGDMDEGIGQFSKIFYNPEDYDVQAYENIYTDDSDAKKIACFVPGWKYYVTDADGNSIEKESKERIEQNRIRLADSNNSKKLLEEVIARPENPDEIFMIVKGTRFNTAKLNTQRARIMKSKNPEAIPTRINIKYTYDGIPRAGLPHGNITGVEWEYAKDGEFIMFHEPEMLHGKPQENRYFGGTDSYDKDEALTSDSNLSTSIFDGRTKQFVARYTGRPGKAEDAHEKSFMLCLMYGARNLIEYSNISIFAYAEQMGLTHMLKERPRNVYADVINSKVVNQWGVDPNTRGYWLTKYGDYIEDHSADMWDLEQITKALMFRDKTEKGKKYNCDITISSSIAYVHYLDEIEYVPMDKDPTREQKEEFVYFRAVNGVITNQLNRNGFN